ncbi:MAG: sulfotransferase domain-containing protein [bacterium]
MVTISHKNTASNKAPGQSHETEFNGQNDGTGRSEKYIPQKIKQHDHEFNAKLRSVAGLVPNTESVDEDVFIVGHPKSGTTWLQNLVAGEFAPNSLVFDLVPGHRQHYYKRYRTPSFFKSHRLPQPEYKRVIYLVRDGRDVMVSYFHHLKAVKKKEIDFLKVVTAEEVIWPYKWHEHVEAWLSNPHGAQMIIMKYEDLKSNPVKELRRFCEFVDVQREDSLLESINQKASFEKMRQKEARFGIGNRKWPDDKFFIRRGEVGSYQDEMPSDILEMFLRDAGDTLRKLGYL